MSGGCRGGQLFAKNRACAFGWTWRTSKSLRHRHYKYVIGSQFFRRVCAVPAIFENPVAAQLDRVRPGFYAHECELFFPAGAYITQFLHDAAFVLPVGEPDRVALVFIEPEIDKTGRAVLGQPDVNLLSDGDPERSVFSGPVHMGLATGKDRQAEGQPCGENIEYTFQLIENDELNTGLPNHSLPGIKVHQIVSILSGGSIRPFFRNFTTRKKFRTNPPPFLAIPMYLPA